MFNLNEPVMFKYTLVFKGEVDPEYWEEYFKERELDMTEENIIIEERQSCLEDLKYLRDTLNDSTFVSLSVENA